MPSENLAQLIAEANGRKTRAEAYISAANEAASDLAQAKQKFELSLTDVDASAFVAAADLAEGARSLAFVVENLGGPEGARKRHLEENFGVLEQEFANRAEELQEALEKARERLVAERHLLLDRVGGAAALHLAELQGNDGPVRPVRDLVFNLENLLASAKPHRRYCENRGEGETFIGVDALVGELLSPVPSLES